MPQVFNFMYRKKYIYKSVHTKINKELIRLYVTEFSTYCCQSWYFKGCMSYYNMKML